MKVLFFRFLVLSAFFGLCCCMDGFFNSSEFDAMEEDFGFDFFTSVRLGPSGNFLLRKYKDKYSMEEMMIDGFNIDHSLIVGRD